MSRNGSGTYNLPSGNPVTSGTTSTSSWANTTMQNIADGPRDVEKSYVSLLHEVQSEARAAIAKATGSE